MNLIPNMYYRIKRTKNRLELTRNVGSPMGWFPYYITISYNLNQLIAKVEIGVFLASREMWENVLLIQPMLLIQWD